MGPDLPSRAAGSGSEGRRGGMPEQEKQASRAPSVYNESAAIYK